MLAAKSFEAISDMTAVERWIMILAEELSERMIADNKLFNRRPRSLHLHYRYAACDYAVASCIFACFLIVGMIIHVSFPSKISS